MASDRRECCGAPAFYCGRVHFWHETIDGGCLVPTATTIRLTGIETQAHFLEMSGMCGLGKFTTSMPDGSCRSGSQTIASLKMDQQIRMGYKRYCFFYMIMQGVGKRFAAHSGGFQAQTKAMA
jgi:hypothetical protein